MNRRPDPSDTARRSMELIAREVLLRDAARKLELDTVGDPELAAEARRLIRMANGLRRIRIALLDRSGLSR